MFNSDTVDSLMHFVDQEINKYTIPYKKGNTIRIGQYAIRMSDDVYRIFDCVSNRMINQTFSKAAAIAIAKNLDQGVDLRSKILPLDDLLQKHYADAVFYKNIINTSTDTIRRDIRKARLQVAMDMTRAAYEDLEQFVFIDHK